MACLVQLSYKPLSYKKKACINENLLGISNKYTRKSHKLETIVTKKVLVLEMPKVLEAQLTYKKKHV